MDQVIEGLLSGEADGKEIGAQGDTYFQLQEGDVPLKTVGLFLAVVRVDYDPTDRVVGQLDDLFHVVWPRNTSTLTLPCPWRSLGLMVCAALRNQQSPRSAPPPGPWMLV